MTEQQSWVVETRDLTRIYGDGEEIRALDGVNRKVAPGEFVRVMGPSGSGKSTLLNMIGALDRPSQGSVLVDGQDLAVVRDKDQFPPKTVGFVVQRHNLIPTLPARENVEVPMAGYVSARGKHERADELLMLVGLSHRQNHLPNQLSDGGGPRGAMPRA